VPAKQQPGKILIPGCGLATSSVDRALGMDPNWGLCPLVSYRRWGLVMRFSWGWRGLGAALGVAIVSAVLSMSAITPAAAFPIQQDPAGHCNVPGFDIVITQGPLAGFCGQDSGNPATICPPGYTQVQFTQSNGIVVPVCDVTNPGLSNPFNDLTIREKIRQQLIAAKMVADFGAPGDDGDKNEKLTNDLIYDQITSLRAEGLSDEAINELYSGNLNVPLQISAAPGHLGMSVPSSNGGVFSVSGYGGGASTTSSGYGVTDSAGLFAGTTTPSFRAATASGGLTASYDVSRMMPTNQTLLFRGFFDYAAANVTLGATPGLPAASSGSLNINSYTFGGGVRYGFGANYIQASAAGTTGNGTEFQAIDGSTGSFNTSGYWTDVKVGRTFLLANTIRTAYSALPAKAPPKATGGYVVGLDLSGHLGYADSRIGGFTDSTGFILGNSDTRYWDSGLKAKLFLLTRVGQYLWSPYVAATVDQQFGYSSNLFIPNQAAFPGGDTIGLLTAQTFWGAQAGLDVRAANGWTVGVRGFYRASSDTTTAGGTAYLRIPLNPVQPVSARY
jgi:hypothetical protein